MDARLLRPLVALAVVTAACTSPSRPTTGETTTGGSEEVVNRACTPGRRYAALVKRGGPFCLPKDAIRAVDDPRFAPVSSARFLDAHEPVASLVLGGRSRAYPLRILVWHEIVNDAVGDIPVAITFCPLCGTALAFDRRVDGRTLTFGVSGRLIGANLVMFDRETETWWQQVTGKAVRGPLAPARLRLLPLRVVSFADFRRANPRGLVLTEDTGLGAPYGEDPYGGYAVDAEEPSAFQFGAEADPRVEPMARVFGVAIRGQAAAVPYPPPPGDRLEVRFRLAGRVVVATLRHGVGETGTTRRFEAQPTGWSAVAHAVRPNGRRVDLPGTEAFWFAWARFYPDSRVIRP